MLFVKSTVRPFCLHIACAVINAALELELPDVTITAGKDGQHKPGSEHGRGNALDARTKNIRKWATKRAFCDLVKKRLGPLYDVLLEDLGGPNEHLHVERDSRRAVSAGEPGQ